MSGNKRIYALAAGIMLLGAAALALTVGGLGRQISLWIWPPQAFSLQNTSMEGYAIPDFAAVHSPVGGDANEFLIFGNIPVAQPASDLSPDWAAFLGRWEGYSFAPPVKKDWKFVLTVQDITAEGGTAFLYFGTNLQYPTGITKVHFRTKPGDPPAIEWEYTQDGRKNVCTLASDPDTGGLEGWIREDGSSEGWGPIRLTRDRTFVVYQEYAAYLAGKRIQAVTYTDEYVTRHYGPGFLVYLPEGYEEQPDRQWPLLFFLHGSGDRGENLYVLAKASPFMMIREKGPLPFIIVAPLLKSTDEFRIFPEAYLDLVLDQALADYRVDRQRVYLTGLSLGGEATYRFALHRPEDFAAIAALSSFLVYYNGLEGLKGIPVWTIHGADDSVIPLARAQQAVDALRKAGVDVRFSVLENHDHDVWTDTYRDPAFYDWLLQYSKP
jgi:predicted esterase